MRRFGESDKITEAKEVLTLIRGGLTSVGSIASGGAPTDAQYVTLATDSVLTNERVLTAGDGIDLTDGGAGTTVTLAVDVTDILGAGLTETSNNLVLGTPTTLTNVTTNSVAGTTHAHALDLSGFDLGDLAAGVFANPTASVGLAAVNGAATTAMRSDAAPALDQGIIPTWTGVHTHQANVVLDDGTGDSPRLRMIGGTNDDTADLYLVDSATAGISQVRLVLAGTATGARFNIVNKTPETVFRFTALGEMLVGSQDSTRGQIQLYAEGAASTQGGLLLFHVAADHDTTFASWNLDADEDDLRVYSSDAASIHYFRAGGNVEIAGDFNLATGKGIIHADGVTSGYILQADGTRYVPADPAGVLPVAPSARGHILRAEVGPVWASYAASTAGAVLIGDGTDVISDTTPTLVGDLTMDDGTGDSPAVNFVGGTNNDTAKVYLADNATVTDSDLIIQLCDTAGDSVLGIHDSTPAAVLEIDSNGNVELQNDGTWVGRGAGSARIEFNAAGNAVKLYSGADLELYSDAGSTKVGTWDGATGNITLDDGSGDSPIINLVGGTNDDTVKIYCNDSASAGYSDLVLELADAAGNSKVLIRDSTPAEVVKIDSNGSIELMVDGAWIGQSAGVQLTFDDTNNELEVSGGYVGIGLTGPHRQLQIHENSSLWSLVQFSNTTTANTNDTDGAAVGIDENEDLIMWNYENENAFIGTNNTKRISILAGGNVGIGSGAVAPGSILEIDCSTENLEFVDAGSAGATEQDWIQVQVGGNTGYIRVFASV
jgi:hypothetical protein